MRVLSPAALLLALGCLASPVSAQSRFDSIRTARGMCGLWVAIPGGSGPADTAYSRCALDRSPVLRDGNRWPPAPTMMGGASGEYTVIVNPEGSVDAHLTRPWTGSMDTVFDRRLGEAIRGWRFEPGVKDGRAVRSGFRLIVDSGLRNDTIPARLRWRYIHGTDADTLYGTWVPAEAAPLTEPLRDSVYAAVLLFLVQHNIVRPDAGPAYCVLTDAGDSLVQAHLRQLAGRVLYGSNAWGIAGPGCERDPRALRLLLPRLRPLEDHRVSLEPSGDYLRDWPPMFEGRTWRAWMAQCSAAALPGQPVEVECSWMADLGAEPYRDAPLTGESPFAGKRPDSVAPRFAVVGASPQGFRKDTLFATVPDVPVLGDHAVRDLHAPRCINGEKWMTFTSQRTGQVFIVSGDMGAARAHGPGLSVTPVEVGPPTSLSRRRSCEEGASPDFSLAAFILGDVGDRVTEPITLCLGNVKCERTYVLDPDRDLLARRAPVRFAFSDVRPEARVDGQLFLHIYADRSSPDVRPLVIYHFADRWKAELARVVSDREWSFQIIVVGGYPPDTDFRIYFFRWGPTERR